MFPKLILEVSKLDDSSVNQLGALISVSSTDKKPPFFDLLSLSIFLGVDVGILKALERTNCKGCYKTYYIDKKTKKLVPKDFPGNLREINAPVEELKELQKKLGKVFEVFPYHDANKGFIAGRGIKDAIEAVKDGETLIHFDIEKFFDNHSSFYVRENIKELYKNAYGVTLDIETLNAIVAILCKDNKLPQGSPVSPLLVVTLNKDMDEKLQEIANKFNLVYARYADDLSFSGKIDNVAMGTLIDEVTEAIHPFKVNYKKLGIMRHSAKPIFKGVKVTFEKGLTSVQIGNIKTAIRVALGVTDYSFFISNKEGVPRILYFYSKEISALDRKEVTTVINKITELVKKATTLDFVIKPEFYYIQSVKRLLGANIQDGSYNFPRKEYENLRLVAMLMGRQRAIKFIQNSIKSGPNPESHFNGSPIVDYLSNLLAMFSMNGKVASIKGNLTTESYRDLLHNPLNRKVFNGMLAHIQNIDPIKASKLKAIEEKAATKAKESFVKLARHLNINIDDFNIV